MAGPGGSFKGGGSYGGGGSFSGGGRGYGGYGGYGGHRGHYHGGYFFYGPRFGMFGFGPRWYRPYYGGYYGGGLFGGLFALLMLPIILVLVAAVMLLSSVGTAFSAVANGGVVQFNETKFEEFAGAEYASAFGTNENNILLVVSVPEDYEEAMDFITYRGDYLNQYILDATAGQGSAIDSIVKNTVPKKYDNAMTQALAGVTEKLAYHIEGLNLKSSFRYDTQPDPNAESYLVNKSQLEINETTVNLALNYFTETTDVPMVIVVADAEDIFGRTIPLGAWVTIIIALALIGIAVWLFVRNLLDKRQAKKNGFGKGDKNNSSGGYNNGNGNWYNSGN